MIDLSEIKKDFGGVLTISEDLAVSQTDFMGEQFTFSEPLRVEGSITNNTKSLKLEALVTGKMGVHCARCNQPMEAPVRFRVKEILAEEDAEVSEDEDIILYSGNELELDEIVINSFLMNVSGKFLCKEDCKGLCPHCGQNLNQGDCDCDNDTFDPRWAALKEIMEKTSDTE